MSFFPDLRTAITKRNGRLLGALFNPTNPDYTRAFAYSSNHSQIRDSVRHELSSVKSSLGLTNIAREALVESVVGLWTVIYDLERGDTERRLSGDDGVLGYWGRVYMSQKSLVQIVSRGFTSFNWQNWMLPVLYSTCKYLRELAISADEEDKRDGKKGDKLEDAARHLNKAFTLCLSDRAVLEESRKWGTYYIVNLLFKTYFKLNAVTLSKNVLRALRATHTDMPPLELFPKSHIVTFKYYVGVISFLEEDYVSAEESLIAALQLCNYDSVRNKELILTYLIPSHLMTTHQLPSLTLFSNFPRLKPLFAPICSAIRHGNLLAFETALEHNEEEYVKRRIYLTLERSRDIAMRNLFRRVFMVNDRKTRISVEEFRKAMGFSIAGKDGGTRKEVEPEEVECLLAGMIYKGLMKGYISREKGMVVLSGKQAFPGTGV